MLYMIIESSRGSSMVGYVGKGHHYPDTVFLDIGDKIAISGYYCKHPSVDDFHITSIFNYSLQEKINGEKNG